MPSLKAADIEPLEIRTAKPSSVRAVNRSIMLELIRRLQPISRADLARITGIFRSSVSEIIDELVEQGLLVEKQTSASGRPGRIPKNLSLNELSYPVLGINIRPKYFQVAFAGLTGNIRRSLKFETPGSPKELVRALVKAIRTMQKEIGWNGEEQFRRIGIAIPGHVDAASGQIVWVPTHTELNGFPIAATIEKLTGIQTLVDNDCNLGARSELWISSQRTAERSEDFVFLNVSDFGTGAGVVVDGEIYRSHNGHFAAEVGHMVVDRNGPMCSCGRHGCWELYVSNSATWGRVYPGQSYEDEGFLEMLAQARSGNKACLASLHKTAEYLSLGISNIGFLFNPAEIVVAGRITWVWDLVEQTVLRTFESSRLNVKIRPAHLSADDPLLHGAVCLALREIFAGPKFGQN
jgi:predicted NBD/HSP70 family sugar kinase/biotin operon repressor